MSRRTRTHALSRFVGGASSIALWTIAGVHALWAAGSSWPAADRDRLADLVVGSRPFPSSALTWLVTAALIVAGGIVAWRSELTQLRGSDSVLARRVTLALAAVFLLRGIGGLVASGLALAEASDLFRSWDLRLYSPLCLVIGVAVALVARNRPNSTERHISALTPV